VPTVPTVEFAETDAQLTAAEGVLTQALATTSAAPAGAAIEALAEAAVTALDNASSFDEALATLAAERPATALAELSEELTKALFASQVAGGITAQDASRA
jgi:phage gp29-like protein